MLNTMSCADVMYQPYSAAYFPYQRASLTNEAKKFSVPKMHEPLETSSDFSNSTTTNQATTTSAVIKEESNKDSQAPSEAHYLSANCVLFTYFTGDTSSVVDEHFSRALSQPSSFSSESSKNTAKGLSPMSQRNFPPSFWNSNYHPSPHPSQLTSSLGPHHDLSFTDPYYSSSLHGLHQSDPWHYQLTSQSTYTHRTPMHDLAYSVPSANRFNPQYSSLILQSSVRPSRLSSVTGQCKAGESWATARYHDSLAPDLGHLDAGYTGNYSSMAGLEASVQDGTKDLYWF